MTRDEIHAKVKDVLVDALGVDEDEVKPESVIRDDLGAESIDFLDIMFRLEKAFGIKIPKGEMMPDNLATNPELVKDGVLTAAGLALVKTKMPHAAAEFKAIESDPKLDNLSKLFTVNSIVNYVESKLKA
jgi:acyl carrier protein